MCMLSGCFQSTGVKPLMGPISVRPQGGYPGPPPSPPIKNPSLPRRPIPRRVCVDAQMPTRDLPRCLYTVHRVHTRYTVYRVHTAGEVTGN